MARLKLFIVAAFLNAAIWGQTVPSALLVVRQYNITSASQYIDNRPNSRQSNSHSFCATGSGTWSMRLEYSDTSASGPYTSLGSSATVTNTSTNCIGFGLGYHAFIRLNPLVGSPTGTYTGWKDAFMQGGGSTGTALGSGMVLMTHDTTGAWSVLDPFGLPISTTGSTCQGLQEAINYAHTNGYELVVEGGGVLPPPGNQDHSLLTCTAPITIPTSHNSGYHFHNVDLKFTGSAAADFITFDTADDLYFDFNGQIIYSGNAAAIRFLAVNDNGETYIGFTSCRFWVHTIAIVNSGTLAPESTHGTAVRISPTNGSFINNSMDVLEINGGLIGVQVDNPAGGQSVNLNQFRSTAFHGQGQASILVGTSAGAAGAIYGNQWDMQLNPTSGGIGADIWGGQNDGNGTGGDFYRLSIAGGSTGVRLNSSAVKNTLLITRNAATTRITDSSTLKDNLFAEAWQRGAGAPTNNCYVGQLYFNTSALAGQNLYGCTSTNVWTVEAGSGTGSVTVLSGTTDPSSGPISCTPVGTGTVTVYFRTDTSPRQYWWCDTLNHWQYIFSSATGFLASTNGGLNVNASAFTGILKMTSGTASVATAGTDYAVATNGTNGQGLTSNGAGGFGTAVTFAPSATTDALNASNISSGTLGNARLGANVVRTDQTNTYTTGSQNFQSATSLTLPAAASLTASANQIGVDSSTGYYHINVSATDRILPYRATTLPTNGNCVQWGALGILAEAASSCGSGGGSGAICTVVRTSSTVMTVATSASASAPCILAIGNKSYLFTTAVTFTISANGGTGYIYMTSAGGITIGYGGGTFAGGNVTTVGGTATFGVTAFPDDALPLAIVTATTATWDVAITQEKPESSGMPIFLAGSNIVLTKTNTSITIASSGAPSNDLSLDFPAHSGYYGASTPNGIPSIAFTTSAGARTQYYDFVVPPSWTGTLADVRLWIASDGTDATKTYRLTVSVGCSGIAGGAIVYNAGSNFSMNDSATQYVAIGTTVTSVNITNCVAGGLMVLRVVDEGTTAAVYTSPSNHFLFAGSMKWH